MTSRLIVSDPKVTINALFHREGMFRFDSAERANREPAASVPLQVFDVCSRPIAGFLERLHRPMAIFAAHELIAFCERFEDSAWEPTPTHLHLALCHHRRFLLSSHGYEMPPNKVSAPIPTAASSISSPASKPSHSASDLASSSSAPQTPAANSPTLSSRDHHR
jgi:hypothetical protein